MGGSGGGGGREPAGEDEERARERRSAEIVSKYVCGRPIMMIPTTDDEVRILEVGGTLCGTLCGTLSSMNFSYVKEFLARYEKFMEDNKFPFTIMLHHASSFGDATGKKYKKLSVHMKTELWEKLKTDFYVVV